MGADGTIDLDGINAVLRTALDAVIVMDTEGVVRGWNDVAERCFGIAAGEALGKRMSELIIPHRFRAAHEAGLARFMATGAGPVIDQLIEIEALTADGREIPVELSITYTEHFGRPLFLGFLRDVSQRREAERMQGLLVEELNHRVKNLLGVVSGIAHLTARNASTLDEFADGFTGRLAALGRSHEILTSASWDRASLGHLLTALVEPYAEGGRIEMRGEEVLLGPRDFLAVGMILYELLTNAGKYGALASPAGRLAIAWQIGDDGLRLTWSERGGAPVAPPARTGFGTRMIDSSVRHDLGGKAEWSWNSEGLTFGMTFKPR
jgi:PAS domain S-box-containing protein